MNRLLIAFVLGQLVGLLGWVDALFLPFVLAAPIVVGAVAASRQLPFAPVAVLWASAGLSMLWTDWLVNREDVLFHLATAVVMPLLAGVGWGVVTLVVRGRTRSGATA